MNETKREAKLYVAAGRYESQSVVALRKAAQGKIKNAKSLRKVDLVKALAEFDVTQAEREQLREDGKENRAAFKKAVKGNAKAKAKPTKRNRCQVCDKRPVDRHTAGRDSTLCTLCFEYAGEENRHSDEDHETYFAKLQNGEFDSESVTKVSVEDMINSCPVCQGENPADAPARKNGGSKPGRKLTPQPKRAAGQTKGDKFAEDARAAGWRVRRETGEKGHLEIVTASAPGGEWIRIEWLDGVFQYKSTAHKGADGKQRTVRNASAARRILEG